MSSLIALVVLYSVLMTYLYKESKKKEYKNKKELMRQEKKIEFLERHSFIHGLAKEKFE